jgi:F-type H+-transporting ATPase subunit gamma
MTERLSDVTGRIASVRQLSAVITAMRGIAAARSREARERLDGIRAYAATIAEAIGIALTFLPERLPAAPAAPASDGHAIIALCAEQGFAGTFNEHVLDAAARLMADDGGSAGLLLAGDRGLMVAAERAIPVAWSAPMIAHAGQAEMLADRLGGELYRRIETGRAVRVSVVHALPGGTAVPEIVSRTLVPFDYSRFPPARAAVAPLIGLPPQTLLARLAEEYVFAELCEAVMLSFAAENEARMRAMIAAKSNVAGTLDTLLARSRQLRQEEITSEIIELAGGAGATAFSGSSAP